MTQIIPVLAVNLAVMSISHKGIRHRRIGQDFFQNSYWDFFSLF